MRVTGKIANSTTNGPGVRSIVHFNGCNLQCSGCWNPETHKPDLSLSTSITSIYNWFAMTGNKGITFSGGEPMQQPFALLRLMELIKKHLPETSIGMYTGYTERELEQGRYHRFVGRNLGKDVYNEIKGESAYNPWPFIRAHLDFAVMGRFNKDKITTDTPLVSSSNQVLKLFSGRYTEADFPKQEFEVTFRPDGLVNITGFPIGLEDTLLNSRDW